MIRAYIIERKEYLYPESDEFSDLANFYGVLAGYKIKGLTIVIDNYSKVNDSKGNSLYENDSISVEFSEKAFPIRENNYKEEGYITFANGCFWMKTDDNLLWVMSNTMFGEDFYKVNLIKGKRNERIKQI